VDACETDEEKRRREEQPELRELRARERGCANRATTVFTV